MIAIKGKATKTGPSFDHGTFEAFLQEVHCYTKEDFNTKEPQVGLTFLWNMGEHPEKADEDVIFFDSFVTLYQDDDGYPVIGGKGGKMYKRLYGLFGKEFDPTSEDIDFEITFPKQFDDPERLLNMPMWNSYGEGEARLKIRSIKIEGKELIAQSAMIELGNAKMPGPSNKVSDKTSVIDCKPMPKVNKRRAPAPVAEDEDEVPAAVAKPRRQTAPTQNVEPVDEEFDGYTEDEAIPV